MALSDLPHESYRQLARYFKPILLANFKEGEFVRLEKTIVFSDYYAFRLYYRVDGVERRGDFKMTDAGEITPIILPKKEWNFGPRELMEW